MEAAQGGAEIQAVYHGAEALLLAQVRLRAGAGSAALHFYLWGVPNALLFTVSMAMLLRLALRLCGFESALWLLALPHVPGTADLVENLTPIVSQMGDPPFHLAWASAGATAVRLVTGQRAQLLVLALYPAALLRWVVRRRAGKPAI
jgi:hypothetical protein